jgi:hypothetical protein
MRRFRSLSTERQGSRWALAALTCLALGSAQAADKGPRHHAAGQFDTLTATYVVAEGDELIVIGERLEVPVEHLKGHNKLASDRLAVGQRLAVPAAAAPAAADAVKPVLEPKALDVLKAMGERLARAKALSFTALVTEEHPSRLGPALAYRTRYEVLLQRPDRLRVVTAGDGPAAEYYYDGKTLMAYAPAEDLVAVAEAPATIDASLQAAYQQAGVYLPFTDLVVADPFKDLSEGLVHAFYMGQSRLVGGTLTDMVAFANQDVFVQAWIGAEDRLPRLARAVFAKDPLRLRSVMEFSDWQIDPATTPEAFASAKAGAAKRIELGHPVAPPATRSNSTQPKSTQSK